MAVKQRILFLSLTLACFVGLIATFIVDGYLGVYDTTYITAGEIEQKVEPDFWLRSARWQDGAWSTQASRGERVLFRYEVENRQFSTYTTEVSISLWRSQNKLSDLISQPMSVAPFDKEELTWEVDTQKFKVASETDSEQPFDFSVIIQRGEIERRIIVHVLGTPKLSPVPSR